MLSGQMHTTLNSWKVAALTEILNAPRFRVKVKPAVFGITDASADVFAISYFVCMLASIN